MKCVMPSLEVSRCLAPHQPKPDIIRPRPSGVRSRVAPSRRHVNVCTSDQRGAQAATSKTSESHGEPLFQYDLAFGFVSDLLHCAVEEDAADRTQEVSVDYETDEEDAEVMQSAVQPAKDLARASFQLRPSVGTWFMPRSFAADEEQPVAAAKPEVVAGESVEEEVTSSFQLRPSVGTWFMPRSFAVDEEQPVTTAKPEVIACESVEEEVATSFRLRPSVGTWFMPRSFAAAEEDRVSTLRPQVATIGIAQEDFLCDSTIEDSELWSRWQLWLQVTAPAPSAPTMEDSELDCRWQYWLQLAEMLPAIEEQVPAVAMEDSELDSRWQLWLLSAEQLPPTTSEVVESSMEDSELSSRWQLWMQLTELPSRMCTMEDSELDNRLNDWLELAELLPAIQEQLPVVAMEDSELDNRWQLWLLSAEQLPSTSPQAVESSMEDSELSSRWQLWMQLTELPSRMCTMEDSELDNRLNDWLELAELLPAIQEQLPVVAMEDSELDSRWQLWLLSAEQLPSTSPQAVESSMEDSELWSRWQLWTKLTERPFSSTMEEAELDNRWSDWTQFGEVIPEVCVSCEEKSDVLPASVCADTSGQASWMMGSPAGSLRRFAKQSSVTSFRLDKNDSPAQSKRLTRKPSLTALFDSLGSAQFFGLDKSEDAFDTPRVNHALPALKVKHVSSPSGDAKKTRGKSMGHSTSAMALDLGTECRLPAMSTGSRCSSVGALRALKASKSKQAKVQTTEWAIGPSFGTGMLMTSSRAWGNTMVY